MILDFYKTPSLTIRRMNIEDSTPASILHGSAFKQRWSYASFYSFLNNPQIFGWSVYLQGNPMQMLGLLLLRLVTDEAEILTILTKPEWAGNGVASKLMCTAMSFLHEVKANSCYLEVDENNLRAVKLYEKFRFKSIALRKAYYQSEPGQKRTNAIVMRYNFCYAN